MRAGKTVVIVVLALFIGGILSQLPLATADDSNPLSALWDAIFDLQSRDRDLQAQIDELRAEKDALLVKTSGEPVFISDLHANIEVETTDGGHTLVYITVGNNGADRAAGVKLTTFYLMPLFEINSIEGGQCEDRSRGIIECILGTLEADQKSVITIDATARESGKANTWTVDVSTTTHEANYSNNHVTYNFETGSGGLIEIPQVKQPEEHEDVQDETDPEPEQDDSSSNGGSAGTKESHESRGNPTSSETIEDSGSRNNKSSTETEEQGQEQQGTSEESSEDGSESGDGGESSSQ